MDESIREQYNLLGYTCEDYPACWFAGKKTLREHCESCRQQFLDCYYEKRDYFEYWEKRVLALRPLCLPKAVIPQVPVRPVNVPAVPVHASVYEFTLTTTKDDPYELRQFLTKFTQSAMYAVVAWKACLELTNAGLPHIHAIIYSRNKYCDATKVKKLGFPYRYELKRVRDLVAYNNYLLKEKDNPAIIAYCENKGIPQFWSDGIREEENEQANERQGQAL